jgi:hypothetical protein
MTALSLSANLEFFIKGAKINAPLGWSDIATIANFDNDAVQANIETDKFTFVLSGYEAIRNHVDGGNIFEGLPFEIRAINRNRTLTVFNGYIDTSKEKGFVLDRENETAEAGILKKNGLNSLEKRSNGLTFSDILERGIITSSDYVNVEYKVEKPIQLIEILQSSIVLFLMVKELTQEVKELAKDIANTSAEAAGGIIGAVGAALYAAAVVIIRLAYATAIYIAIINIAKVLLETFISPKRVHKAMTLRRLLEKASKALGYTFVSDLSDLDNIVYLPSNPTFDTVKSNGFINKVGTITKGIPNSVDFGYNVGQFFKLVKDAFLGKFAIINNELQFYFEGSPNWIKNSTYVMPDVLSNRVEYNTDELNQNYILSFQTDISDSWTIDNFTGTNYQVGTTVANLQNQDAELIEGLKKVRLPVALGNRKDKLNALETTLKTVAGFIDDATKVFGKSTNFKARITSSLGVLKVSDNNHRRPKVLWIQNGKIPPNHRDNLSAKALYEKYHFYTSFVQSEFVGQKELYNNIEIPFGLEDFVKLTDNSYFTDKNGNRAKATKIEWIMGEDKANIDYYVRKPYTTNLVETFIEG